MYLHQSQFGGGKSVVNPMLSIYHNPRCGKSRQTLKIIDDSGSEVEIIEYLKVTPSESELKNVLKKLGVRPQEIIRKGELIFKENYKGKTFTDEEWIRILVKNPILIERPIVVKGDQAILGRPPENVKKLL